MEKRRFRKFDKFKLGWLQFAKQFFWMVVLVFLVFRFVIGISFVKGDSMEPTLHTGEMVMFNRLTRITMDYEYGDVVSVRVPSNEYYVKRVIAVEGDTVDIRNGIVYVNEAPLDEPYTQGQTQLQEGLVNYPYTLGEDQVFVMGDNRDISMDSREFGAVNARQIKGKLWLHMYQFKMGTFY